MTEETMKMFRDSGAVLEGHFLLTSGLHSPVYWEKFMVLQYPQYTEKLCKMMADNFRASNPELVVGPTTGGVILAYEVARQLGVRGIFAESGETGRVFRRGFHIKPGERVLIVDDVLTTGGSVKDMVEAVKATGAVIVGIAVLVDRSYSQRDFGYPLFSCVRAGTVAYSEEECPFCKQGLPLTRLGGIKAHTHSEGGGGTR